MAQLKEHFDTSSTLIQTCFDGTGRYAGQTFTATTTYRITSVRLWSDKAGTSTGTFFVEIRPTSSGKPTGNGTALCSGSIAKASVTNGGETEISLGAGATLTSGTVYSIVFYCDASGEANAIGIYGQATSGYADGTFTYTTDDGTTWNTQTKDLYFQNYSINIKKIAGIWKTAASGSSAGLLTNLAGGWKFNEAAGASTAVDVLGVSDLTKANSATFATGKIGNGTDLEASTTDYWHVNDNAALSITGDLSIEGWVKIESAPADRYTICSKFEANSPANQRSYWLQYRDDGGTKKLEGSISDDGVGRDAIVQAADLGTGVFHHVAFVFTAASSKYQFYVDGAQVGTDQTGTHTSIYNSTASFAVGAYNTDGDAGSIAGLFDGIIDELYVHSKALTSTEVALLYNGGTGMDYPFRSIKKISGISKP